MICNTNANGGKVLGVKGSEESEYRKGNVEITPSNLGITVINNTADSNKIVAQAAKLGSTTVGSATSPIYLSNGKATAGSTYAGGTKVTLNGASKGASTASFYAPTSAGTAGLILTSNGSGAPIWSEASNGGDDYPIGSLKLSSQGNPNFYGDEWTIANGSTITNASDEFKLKYAVEELILDNIIYNGNVWSVYYNNVWLIGNYVSFDEGETMEYIDVPYGRVIANEPSAYYYNGYWYIVSIDDRVSYSEGFKLYLYKTTDFNTMELVTSITVNCDTTYNPSTYRHEIDARISNDLDGEAIVYVEYSVYNTSSYNTISIKETAYLCTDTITEYTGENPYELSKIGDYYYYANLYGVNTSFSISTSLNGSYHTIVLPSEGTLVYINGYYCLFNISNELVSSFYSYDLETWNIGGVLIYDYEYGVDLVSNKRTVYLLYRDGTQFATNDGISWTKTSHYSDLCNFLLRDAGKAIVAYDSTMRLIVKCTSNSLGGINVPNLMPTIGVPVFIKVK